MCLCVLVCVLYLRADDELVKSGVFFDTVHLTSLDLSFTHVTSDGMCFRESALVDVPTHCLYQMHLNVLLTCGI